jgi:hypothetical protein
LKQSREKETRTAEDSRQSRAPTATLKIPAEKMTEDVNRKIPENGQTF